MTTMAFTPTRWSQALALGGADDGAARAALAWLARRYTAPLTAWAQRQGLRAEAAEDAVQDFLTRIIERRDLHPDPERGRFRAYLLGAFRHHLAHAREAAAATKRGGGAVQHLGDHDPAAPDAFDRAWALETIAHALAALRDEQTTERQRALCAALEPHLTRNADAERYAALGARLGLSEGAVKVALFRLRDRLRALIRAEVAETLAEPTPAAVDAEVAALLAALA